MVLVVVARALAPAMEQSSPNAARMPPAGATPRRPKSDQHIPGPGRWRSRSHGVRRTDNELDRHVGCSRQRRCLRSTKRHAYKFAKCDVNWDGVPLPPPCPPGAGPAPCPVTCGGTCGGTCGMTYIPGNPSSTLTVTTYTPCVTPCPAPCSTGAGPAPCPATTTCAPP